MPANGTSGQTAGQSPHNCLTRDGAERLAERIRIFWKRQGYEVLTSVTHDGVGRDGLFTVRSDLVDGRPRQIAAAVQADADGGHR